MKKFLTVFLMMNSLVAFGHGGGGGDKVGNGGDVIVCPDRNVELLDLFQGTVDWGFSPLAIKGQRKDIIQSLLKDLQQIDPYVGNILLKRAMELENELSAAGSGKSKSRLLKLTENELVNISDEGVAELPKGCKILQAATQIQRPFPGEVKFTFQKKIWNDLDAFAQSSLILHEVVYEHMIKVGENSSRSARYFNAALNAGAFTSVKKYFEISGLFDFRNLDIQDDARTRFFGLKRLCNIKRDYVRMTEASNFGGTTIHVGRWPVLSNVEDHDTAMITFWKKYARNGVCD